MSENVKRNYKDIAFKQIFGETKGFIDMYKYFTGEELKESEIEKFNIGQNVFKSEFINDVAYMRNKHDCIILLEHQSTQDVNIGLRMMMYYTEMVKKYIVDNNIDIHKKSTKIELPKAQFLIAYNGLQNEKDGIVNIEVGAFKTVANLKNINYNYIQEIDKFEDLKTYSYYVEKIREYTKDGVEKDKIKDILMADCKKDNIPILSDVLGGVVEMSTFYDIEQEFEDAKTIGIEIGIKQGRLEARTEQLNALVGTITTLKLSGINDETVKKVIDEYKLNKSESEYVYEQLAKKSEEYKQSKLKEVNQKETKSKTNDLER